MSELLDTATRAVYDEFREYTWSTRGDIDIFPEEAMDAARKFAYAALASVGVNVGPPAMGEAVLDKENDG